MPDTKGTPGQALSVPEFRTFVAALNERERGVALVLGLAGLRWSELAAPQERDVVRDGRRMFLVRRRWVLDEQGKRVTLSRTKRGREVSRPVPVLPELMPIVEANLTGNPRRRCSPRHRVSVWTRATGDARRVGRRRPS